MTTSALIYQDFGHAERNHSVAPGQSQDEREDEKLQAFENGYQAGWDDAMKAQHELDTAISAALATNLQEASFQYHEMRAQMTRAIKEIMQGVVDVLLPDIATRSLGTHVVQLVESHARAATERPIQICVAPTALDRVERLVLQTPVDHEIKADQTLAPDQANIRLGETEHVIDLGQMIAEIGNVVAAYFETQNVEVQDD